MDYQATYDAVRSRISNGDIGSAVESVLRAENIERPSVLFRPRIYVDGDKWCALYGDNLQDGAAGFGGSPAEAMLDFDATWFAKLKARDGQ